MTSTTKRGPTHEELTGPAWTLPDAATRVWHDRQTRKAIEEADAGDFASAAEVKATLRKFVRDA